MKLGKIVLDQELHCKMRYGKTYGSSLANGYFVWHDRGIFALQAVDSQIYAHYSLFRLHHTHLRSATTFADYALMFCLISRLSFSSFKFGILVRPTVLHELLEFSICVHPTVLPKLLKL